MQREAMHESTYHQGLGGVLGGRVSAVGLFPDVGVLLLVLVVVGEGSIEIFAAKSMCGRREGTRCCLLSVSSRLSASPSMIPPPNILVLHGV